MKLILAIAAFLLTVATVGAAHAQCWQNGTMEPLRCSVVKSIYDWMPESQDGMTNGCNTGYDIVLNHDQSLIACVPNAVIARQPHWPEQTP